MKYPVKNRKPETLPVLRIEIEDAVTENTEGLLRTYDPNSITLACFNGEHRKWQPIPGVSSELTLGPAIRYRSADIELHLTPDEVYRLVMLRLTPREFLILAERYGIFHEIHDDFYDPDTGEALQPKGDGQ